jgi:hypothetical protein
MAKRSKQERCHRARSLTGKRAALTEINNSLVLTDHMTKSRGMARMKKVLAPDQKRVIAVGTPKKKQRSSRDSTVVAQRQ